MKVRFLFSFVVFALLAVFLFSLTPSAVFAGTGVDEAGITEALPPLDLQNVLTTFASLSGVAVLIAALVNIGKMFSLVKDDTAAQWSAGLNLLVLITVIVLQVIGKTNLVPALDSQAGIIANILTSIFGLVWQIFLSRKTHTSVLAGLPVVGTSNSGRVAGEDAYIIDTEVPEE